MQRRHWFELHDHPRFPRFLRDLVTGALEAVWNDCDIYGAIVPRLQQVLHTTGASQIVDLCSGGGGPWLSLSRDIGKIDGRPPKICLTDRFPNRQAFERIASATHGAVQAYRWPVDAQRIPSELTGFRTIFSSFHHFEPEEARAILQDAVDQRQAIGIFEAARRDVRTLIAVIGVPLLALKITPRMRPFLWSRLFWTYCLPVIPLTLWVDGLLSCLRAYSTQDMKELVAGLKAERYRWEIGEDRKGRVGIAYLIGSPLPEDTADADDLDLVETETPA